MISAFEGVTKEPNCGQTIVCHLRIRPEARSKCTGHNVTLHTQCVIYVLVFQRKASSASASRIAAARALSCAQVYVDWWVGVDSIAPMNETSR